MSCLLLNIALCGLALLVSLRWFRCARNHQIAKETGFPVVTSPFDVTEIWWLLLYPAWMRIFSMLPPSISTSWLPFLQRFDYWKIGHRHFEHIGSDTIIVSSPKGNLLQTCDPYVVHQILSKHESVKMNLAVTKIFNIWGPTVGSTEDAEWKAHRKIVTAGLGSDTDPFVWVKAVEETQMLLAEWKKQNMEIADVKPWMSKLALHVVSAVFFHKKLPWTDSGPANPPSDQQLNFQTALMTTISKIRVIFMIPRPVLNRLPFRFARETRRAISDWAAHMRAMRQDVVERIDTVSMKPKKSLLEHIVISAIKDLGDDERRSLPEDYALGNIFFTLLAGHETIGNTLAFLLLLLCIYPEWQVRIQQQLDRWDMATPDVELHEQFHIWYPQLRKGPISAVIAETLRIYNVVQMVWRRVVAPTTVTDSSGIPHKLPAGMLCMVNFSAAHQNPHVWPEGHNIPPALRIELHNSPALDFDPERWLTDKDTGKSEVDGVPLQWPFSQGIHSCPGRGFAFVETTAVIATLLKHHSLQLQIPKGQTPEQVRNQALRTMVDGVQTKLNIEMVKDLPITIKAR